MKRCNMAESLMQLYDTMTETAQKELYDFALYLATKTGNIRAKAKKDIDSSFFGALQKYSNPSLIDQEKDAWANAVAEKYRG